MHLRFTKDLLFARNEIVSSIFLCKIVCFFSVIIKKLMFLSSLAELTNLISVHTNSEKSSFFTPMLGGESVCCKLTFVYRKCTNEPHVFVFILNFNKVSSKFVTSSL